MRTLAVLTGIFFHLLACADDHAPRTLYFPWGGTNYECIVPKGALSAQPKWAAGEPNPPLSVRRADAIAAAYAAELLPEAKSWLRTTISLVHIAGDDWIYEVGFVPSANDTAMKTWPDLRIVVLMGGDVAKYKAQPRASARGDKRL